MGPFPCSAYAKHRGCSGMAVSHAIKSGRLRNSVVYVNGKPKIKDFDLADQEWAGNTDYTDAPEQAPDLDGTIGAGAAAQKYWQAKLAEQKFKKEARELIPANEIEAEWTSILGSVKTKLLGVPSRAKQALPHLSLADISTLETLIREVLTDIAKDEQT